MSGGKYILEKAKAFQKLKLKRIYRQRFINISYRIRRKYRSAKL